MQTLNKGNTGQAVAGNLFPPLVKGGRGIFKIKVAQLISCTFLILLTGCAEWNSHPVVAEQNFGRAVNNMVKNQTLCPEHGYRAQNPTLCPEHGLVTGMDGQKAEGNGKVYRLSDYQKSLEESRAKASTINIAK